MKTKRSAAKPGDGRVVPRWKSGIVERRADSQVYLYEPGSGAVFEVEGLAAGLSERIDGKKAWERIVREVAAEQKLPAQRFKADAQVFLAELLAKGLVELA